MVLFIFAFGGSTYTDLRNATSVFVACNTISPKVYRNSI